VRTLRRLFVYATAQPFTGVLAIRPESRRECVDVFPKNPVRPHPKRDSKRMVSISARNSDEVFG